MKCRGEGILRIENAGISEEDDDIDSQDSNTPIDHGHLAWNCSVKIITPAVKASVVSVMRYVTAEGEVQFLRFMNISDDQSADELYRVVKDIMEDYCCGGKLVAQTYDGAAVMSSYLNGLQTEVRETFPQATFVRCFLHRLSLCLFHILENAEESY